MEQLKLKNKINPVQIKRDEIRNRRRKAHAIAQYKKMKRSQVPYEPKLLSKGSVNFKQAILFSFILFLGSYIVPELAFISVVFTSLLLGLMFKDRLKKESFKKVLTAYERERLKMIRPYKVVLSSKKKKRLPVSRSIPGHSFKDEDGKTISQFDWRQLTQ